MKEDQRKKFLLLIIIIPKHSLVSLTLTHHERETWSPHVHCFINNQLTIPLSKIFVTTIDIFPSISFRTSFGPSLEHFRFHCHNSPSYHNDDDASPGINRGFASTPRWKTQPSCFHCARINGLTLDFRQLFLVGLQATHRRERVAEKTTRED